MATKITLKSHPQFTYEENHKGVVFRVHNSTGQRIAVTPHCRVCRYPTKYGGCLCPDYYTSDEEEVEQYNPKKHQKDPLVGTQLDAKRKIRIIEMRQSH